MKIGIFLPNATFDQPGSAEVGGIETFSFTVGEALQRLGHEVVLFGGEPKAGRRHRETSLALELNPYWETKAIPDIGTRFQRLVQRLHFGWKSRQSWRRQQCEVLLLAKPFDWPVAWWWKRARPDLKVIMGFHGTDYFAGDRIFYGAIDRAFAVSPAVADLAERHVGERPPVIPNPVDLDYFSPSPVPRSSSNSWRLVSSGRLVGWKGHAVLIDAMARLRDEFGIDARLCIAGDGPEQPRLLDQIKRNSLRNVVELPGQLPPSELRELLQNSDLYVLPSIGLEAFSISALEAAAVGLPLVLSDQVGLASFLSPADFVSYSAEDVGRLTALLKELHGRRDAAWTDVSARRARLAAQFSPERAARCILDLLA